MVKTTKISVPVLVLLVSLPVVSARAALSVNFLSESYHVSGWAEGIHYPDGEYVTFSYSLTLSTPPAYGEIIHGARYPCVFDDDADSVLHVYSLATRYSSGGNIIFTVAQNTTDALDFGAVPLNWAEASLVVDFALEGAGTQLPINAWRNVYGDTGPWGWAAATLIDLTTQQSWDILGWPSGGWLETGPTLETSMSVPIDTTHTYRLKMWADAPELHESSITVVFAIPAPGAVLLGTIGMGLVGWLRRRRTL